MGLNVEGWNKLLPKPKNLTLVKEKRNSGNVPVSELSRILNNLRSV